MEIPKKASPPAPPKSWAMKKLCCMSITCSCGNYVILVAFFVQNCFWINLRQCNSHSSHFPAWGYMSPKPPSDQTMLCESLFSSPNLILHEFLFRITVGQNSWTQSTLQRVWLITLLSHSMWMTSGKLLSDITHPYFWHIYVDWMWFILCDWP